MKDGRLEIRLLGPLEMRREGQALCEPLHDGPADPRAALRWSLSKLRPVVNDEHTARLVCNRDQVRFDGHGAMVDMALARQEAHNPAEAIILEFSRTGGAGEEGTTWPADTGRVDPSDRTIA